MGRNWIFKNKTLAISTSADSMHYMYVYSRIVLKACKNGLFLWGDKKKTSKKSYVFLEILDNTRNAKSKGGIKKLIFHVMASFVCYQAQAGQQKLGKNLSSPVLMKPYKASTIPVNMAKRLKRWLLEIPIRECQYPENIVDHISTEFCFTR